MPVAGLSYFLPIFGFGEVRRAADGLGNHGGDVALFFHDIFDIIGAGLITTAAVCAAEYTAVFVGQRRMLGSGQQRTHVPAEDGFAVDGNGVQGGAVKRIPHGDRFVAAGGQAGQFQRDADGFSTAGAEQKFVEIAGCNGSQFFGQIHGNPVGIAAGAERQLIQLFFDSPPRPRGFLQMVLGLFRS